jgi:hypothetical protein
METAPLDDFDTRGFTIISLSFGIPLILVLVLWFYTLHKHMDWQPFRWSRARISRLLDRPGGGSFVHFLWWVLFFLPFVVVAAFGITTIALINDMLGVIILIGPPTILLFIYTYFNYRSVGYRATSASLAAFAASLCLLGVLTVALALMIRPRSWMATRFSGYRSSSSRSVMRRAGGVWRSSYLIARLARKLRQ